METVFKEFHKNLTDRCERHFLLDIGEDSIRYDFFIALSQVKNLKPHEIQLESAMDKQSYVPRNTIGARRKEKPQLDLVVDTDTLRLCAEFGLFRQNSNEKGTINQTARTVKMVNDMIRLGVDTFFTKRRGFFICVADDKMLGHQLRTNVLGRFPSDYIITNELVRNQRKSRTADFDDRFVKKFEEVGCSINAKLIYDSDVKASKVTRPTKALVWEVLAM